MARVAALSGGIRAKTLSLGQSGHGVSPASSRGDEQRALRCYGLTGERAAIEIAP